MSAATFILLCCAGGCVLLGGVLLRAGIELLCMTPDQWAEIERDAISRARRSISFRKRSLPSDQDTKRAG